MARDRWKELCELVKEDDGLPTRPVGAWSEEKLHFWHRYIEITTSAMVGKPGWSGLYYVDLFAGPGVCTLRSSRRVLGSALIAANAKKAFSEIFAVELDPLLANALDIRLKRMAPARSRVFLGNCNEKVREIAACIPDRALTLGFIDPESLHVHFDTVRQLASRGRVDLLVLFADQMDVVRNVDLYERQEQSKLDRFLGTTDWRDGWRAVEVRSPENICRFFASLYEQQLRSELGYKVFGEKVINNSRGQAIYRLIFASKHDLGLEFWNKAMTKDVRGQQELPFGDED